MLKENGEQLLKNFAATAYPPAVTKITNSIYHVMGYAHSNSIIIEAENSVILVDTFETDVRAEKLKKLIADITEKPVKTIIYTHSHPDHRGGAGVFSDTVEEVIAFAPMKPILGRTNELNDVLNKRGSYQFGYYLTDEEVITQGIGIREGIVVGEGKRAFFPPTTVYKQEKVNRTIDGIQVELVPALGETDDQIFIWLPDSKVLCCGDNYYGCFPNLYAIRGGQYRDVSAWVDSLNLIISYPAEYVLPGHTKPLVGRNQVQEVLLNFRDAIEFVLEETLRGMNKGLKVDELASIVKLPEKLAELPYLGEFYGTVAWTVRSIYNGYLGWFDGNPTNLNKLPSKTHAEKMLNLIGSHESVVTEIKRALDIREEQWAVELCDLLISAERELIIAKQLKAKGLMALSKQETSANGRHYYIACAKELLED
ncbi:alkyl/aryl-sulfatase [Paenibacillus alginolyticus]|uniref:Alkyl/aryl-sulfatase n=1 Tax=Paenibacillus alginolyticus TaxID=59839 RepID=A0ABT4G6K2_9BACL|nr:alkyl/aryl-sulfatase [Paenibacillus alginolyticus]MCY9691805.1 alkyl/aryl-sulfatase [Paenibacillus alginolyticus]MEC0143230.1 alkyl/aryl-sulfatase [Paenibacillus alginolyticus]